MIDQIMLILARLFIIDGEILRDLGDFVWCAGQTYKLRVKGAYIVFQHLRRIPLRIDGDKNWLHLGRTCRDRKSTRLNSSHYCEYRMPSSAHKKKKKRITANTNTKTL